jgi:hypothetical protein
LGGPVHRFPLGLFPRGFKCLNSLLPDCREREGALAISEALLIDMEVDGGPVANPKTATLVSIHHERGWVKDMTAIIQIIDAESNAHDTSRSASKSSRMARREVGEDSIRDDMTVAVDMMGDVGMLVGPLSDSKERRKMTRKSAAIQLARVVASYRNETQIINDVPVDDRTQLIFVDSKGHVSAKRSNAIDTGKVLRQSWEVILPRVSRWIMQTGPASQGQHQPYLLDWAGATA